MERRMQFMRNGRDRTDGNYYEPSQNNYIHGMDHEIVYAEQRIWRNKRGMVKRGMPLQSSGYR